MSANGNRNAAELTSPVSKGGRGSLWSRFPSVAIAASLVVCLFVAEADSLGQSGGSVKGVAMKKAVMPVYLDFSSPAVAVLRADRIYPTHQRWGYFRIGLLPMLECDGVTLEVCDAEKTAQALAVMRENLKSQANGTIVEMRQVAIRFTPETTPRLKAASLRLQDHGQWQLSDVTFQSGTNAVHAARALLQVTGAQAGRLSWQSAHGIISANLFAANTAGNNLVSTQRNP